VQSIDSHRIVLEMHDVSKTFRQQRHDVPALVGVDLGLEEGETLGLVGESGSGKTTLAKTMLGIHAPDAGGEVEIEGRGVAGLTTQRTDDERRAVAERTSSRGTVARCRTDVAILPIVNRVSPPDPCVAMTMRSTSSSWATAAILAAGSPAVSFSMSGTVAPKSTVVADFKAAAQFQNSRFVHRFGNNDIRHGNLPC